MTHTPFKNIEIVAKLKTIECMQADIKLLVKLYVFVFRFFISFTFDMIKIFIVVQLISPVISAMLSIIIYSNMCILYSPHNSQTNCPADPCHILRLVCTVNATINEKDTVAKYKGLAFRTDSEFHLSPTLSRMIWKHLTIAGKTSMKTDKPSILPIHLVLQTLIIGGPKLRHDNINSNIYIIYYC